MFYTTVTLVVVTNSHDGAPTSLTTIPWWMSNLPTSTRLCSEPRAPVVPSCLAKIGYEETVRKVYETIQVGKGKVRVRPNHTLMVNMKLTHAVCGKLLIPPRRRVLS